MDASFARRYRLTRTDEFSSVFGFRKVIRGTWLMLHYQPRPENSADARLGLVIGKKLLKRAVDRNRLKRILRERFRQRRFGLPAFDLIVRLAVKPKPFDSKALSDDFSHLLDRLSRTRSRPVEKANRDSGKTSG